MHKVLSFLFCASLVAPGLAEAKEKPAISLAKTSKWEINYDEDSCHLLAKFGEGKQSTVIRLTRYQPGDWFDLSLYGAPVKTEGPQTKVTIGYGLGRPLKVDALTGTSGDKQPLLIVNSQRLDGWQASSPNQTPPTINPAQEAQANGIDLAVPGGKHYRLETGSFGKPMEAMRTCVDNLVGKWGYDPGQQAALTRRALPLKEPRTWLADSDFPMGVLGHNGLVQFRLDIDEAGNATGCHILHRTNPDDFADLTCKLVGKRAKFAPALDKDGKPSRSYFISKVQWLTGRD